VSDTVPPAPWLNQPTQPPDPASHEANVRLIGVLRKAFVDRYTGAWLQADESGERSLFIAVVGATAQDVLTASSVAGQIPSVTPVRIVASAYSEEQLAGFEDDLNQWLDANNVPVGVGSEIRPDLSKIVAYVNSDLPDVVSVLRLVVPSDALLVPALDPTAEGRVLIRRDDVPPYKAGDVPPVK
jgi:hypothetical protein